MGDSVDNKVGNVGMGGSMQTALHCPPPGPPASPARSESSSGLDTGEEGTTFIFPGWTRADMILNRTTERALGWVPGSSQVVWSSEHPVPSLGTRPAEPDDSGDIPSFEGLWAWAEGLGHLTLLFRGLLSRLPLAGCLQDIRGR